MRNTQSIRAVIADDHVMVREGLTVVLERIPGMSVVAQARSWTEAIPVIDEFSPDIALLDVRMPGIDAAEGVAILRRRHPNLRMVLISAFDCDEDIYGVIRAGANGFVVKSCTAEEIPICIHTVLQGNRWLPSGPAAKLAERLQAPELTARQAEILGMVTEGKTNKEVAAALNITEGTVKVQMNHIFHKLGVSNRTEAATRAMERGLVRLNK